MPFKKHLYAKIMHLESNSFTFKVLRFDSILGCELDLEECEILFYFQKVWLLEWILLSDHLSVMPCHKYAKVDCIVYFTTHLLECQYKTSDQSCITTNDFLGENNSFFVDSLL